MKFSQDKFKLTLEFYLEQKLKPESLKFFGSRFKKIIFHELRVKGIQSQIYENVSFYIQLLNFVWTVF